MINYLCEWTCLSSSGSLISILVEHPHPTYDELLTELAWVEICAAFVCEFTNPFRRIMKQNGKERQKAWKEMGWREKVIFQRPQVGIMILFVTFVYKILGLAWKSMCVSKYLRLRSQSRLWPSLLLGSPRTDDHLILYNCSGVVEVSHTFTWYMQL